MAGVVIKYCTHNSGGPVSWGMMKTQSASMQRGKTPTSGVRDITLNNLMLRLQ